jgi:hypothetical protein
LDNDTYPLADTKIQPSGEDAMIVEAGVASPNLGTENQTSIVGHLFVTVSPSEGGRIGKGWLTMNTTKYSGTYQVILDMPPPLRERGRSIMDPQSQFRGAPGR